MKTSTFEIWQVTLADSTDAVLHNLGSGRVDAAILRADVIVHLEQRGLLNTTFFKYVDAVSNLYQALSHRHFMPVSDAAQ